MTINALNPMYINWVTKSAHLFLSSKINGSNKLLVGCKNKQTKKKKRFLGSRSVWWRAGRKAEVEKRFLNNCSILLREKEGRIPLSLYYLILTRYWPSLLPVLIWKAKLKLFLVAPTGYHVSITPRRNTYYRSSPCDHPRKRPALGTTTFGNPVLTVT